MYNFFEKVKSHFNKKLPFVIYKKPNSNKIIGVFQNDDTLHLINNFTEKGFAFVSFDEEKKYYLPFSESTVYVDTLSEIDFIFDIEIETEINEIAKNNFEALVQSGLEAIKKNQFKKVVLSRKEIVQIANLDIETIFKNLNFSYKNSFNYCLYHSEIGLWIAATPEQFVKVERNKLKTVALAGTQLFSENVFWKEKEKTEQQFVTDYIVESLKAVSKNITATEPKTIKAGGLVHLKSEIESDIDVNDLSNIISKLHPTPAVCGFPKEESKKFILNNEGYDREFYSGFIGELNCDFTNMKNKTDLFVNLRCMKIENLNANLYIGCGITKDSVAEKEFIETVNKSFTMKKVL